MTTRPHDLDQATSSSDLETMRERYRIEREKRMRDDGSAQYIEVAGEFEHFIEDPYVEEPIARDPLSEQCDVLVIGGGFGGLQLAARLRQAGVESMRIVEKGADFGGTWYWNRYPGARCDVEAYIYLPLLEELGYIPSEKYVGAQETLEYCSKIGEHFHLYEAALFQTLVNDLRWDEADSRWIVSTNRGDKIHARFVAMANGPMDRPKLPGIQGIHDFNGHIFHTSRWDYDYTGGGPDGGLHKLADKRVAVIGTGCTAVQVVPNVAPYARELYVFQRTPSAIEVRNNRATDPEWAASLEPGWQKARRENFNSYICGVPEEENFVDDAWTDTITEIVTSLNEAGGGDVARVNEELNYQKMNSIRARVESLVADPETAEKLKPYYRYLCKRPAFSDEYLQVFNRPNVNLVDTDGRGVERLSESGVVAQGREYPVDCVIFATGFEVGTHHVRRMGYELTGRGGQTLTQKWMKGGYKTLHGMQTHGFPNCFFMTPAQAGFTVNFPHMLEELSTHIAYIIGHAVQKEFKTVEASREAEEAWVAAILERGKTGSGGGTAADLDCTPGYYNNEGKPSPGAKQAQPYGGMQGTGSIEFFEMIAEWRGKGTFDGVEFGA